MHRLILSTIILTLTTLSSVYSLDTLAPQSLCTAQTTDLLTTALSAPSRHSHIFTTPRFESLQPEHALYVPIWLETQVALSLLVHTPTHTIKEDVYTTAIQTKLREYGLERSPDYIERHIINYLYRNFFIRKSLLESVRHYSLNPAKILASSIWADDAPFIRDLLATALTQEGQPLLQQLLTHSDTITSSLKLYPLEARYPVERAVALLPLAQQQQLLAWLNELKKSHPEDFKRPLINSLWLMLTPQDDDKKRLWFQENTPHITGTIYEVSAEAHNMKGGLGRVELYHTHGMHDLGAPVVFVEPHYRFKRGPNQELVSLNYTEKNLSDPSAISYPFAGMALHKTFTIEMDGQNIEVEVHKAVDLKGVTSFLIRDKQEKYVRVLYEYNDQLPLPKFTEFWTKAVWTFLLIEESQSVLQHPDRMVQRPVINLNDGQSLPLALWRSIDRNTYPLDPIIRRFFISGTTHTYKNRGWMGNFSQFPVPVEYESVFRNSKGPDLTSAGLRSSDFTKAVAAIHGYEMSDHDPSIDLYGVTNGDDLSLSTTDFRSIMQELSLGKKYFDYDLNTNDIQRIKQKAKEKLELNPHQMVISYSGRLVTEKAGRERAFTNDNIKHLVRQGVQLVIYGNEQAFEQSRHMADELELLAKEISSLKQQDPTGYKGRFIYKRQFTLNQQIALLAASDMQVQDSDRGTGASEYTEADISANGGLQMSPPFWEGLIAKQGLAINYTTYEGNTAVPHNSSSEAYRAAYDRLIALYSQEPDHFAQLQLNSIALSRVLKAELTSAEYLRQWHAHSRAHTTLSLGQHSGKFSYTTSSDATNHIVKFTITSDQRPTLRWSRINPNTKEWIAPQDQAAIEQMYPGSTEKTWSITLVLNRAEYDNSQISFALKYDPYKYANSEMWDNNHGHNYSFYLHERKPLPQEATHWFRPNRVSQRCQFNEDGQPMLVITAHTTSKSLLYIHYGSITSQDTSTWLNSQTKTMTSTDNGKTWTITIPMPSKSSNITGFAYTFMTPNGIGNWWSDENHVAHFDELQQEALRSQIKKLGLIAHTPQTLVSNIWQVLNDDNVTSAESAQALGSQYVPEASHLASYYTKLWEACWMVWQQAQKENLDPASLQKQWETIPSGFRLDQLEAIKTHLNTYNFDTEAPLSQKLSELHQLATLYLISA